MEKKKGRQENFTIAPLRCLYVFLLTSFTSRAPELVRRVCVQPPPLSNLPSDSSVSAQMISDAGDLWGTLRDKSCSSQPLFSIMRPPNAFPWRWGGRTWGWIIQCCDCFGPAFHLTSKHHSPPSVGFTELLAQGMHCWLVNEAYE